MAQTQIVQSSSNQTIDQAYKRTATLTPQSCVDLSAKIANVRKHIAILHDQTVARRTLIGQQQFYNKGIFVSTMIRDTCIAFLDMAASLVPGEVNQWVAKIGSASITTSQTIAEQISGQGTFLEKVHRTGDTVLGLVSPKSSAGIVGLGKAQTASNFTHFLAGSATADANTKSREAIKFGVNQSLDSAISIIELAKDGTKIPVLDKVGKGLSVFKTAANYGFNLEAAQDAYFSELHSLQSQLFDAEMAFSQGMRRLTQDLESALASFEECKGLV